MGKRINFESDHLDLVKTFYKDKLPKVLIPKLSFDEDIKNVDINLLHIQSTENKVSVKGSSIFLYDDWSENIVPGYVHFFIFKIFDYLYSKSNFFALHASCVEKNGLATLFVGNPGSGKTSSALNLCLFKGYSLVSNNRTVIKIHNGELVVVGGTNYISIRNKDMFRYSKFLNTEKSFQQSKTGFSLLTPDDLKIGFHITSPEERIKIKNIIKINVGNAENQLAQVSNFNSQILINENISKTQWGEGLLFNNRVVSPKLTSIEEDQNRLNFVIEMIDLINLYDISGSIDFIMNSLKDLK